MKDHLYQNMILKKKIHFNTNICNGCMKYNSTCIIKAVLENVKDINFSKAITCIFKTVCPLIHVPYHCVEIFLQKKCTKHKLVNSKKESMQSLICRWNLKVNVLTGYLELSILDVFKMCFNGTTDSNDLVASVQDSTEMFSNKIISL